MQDKTFVDTNIWLYAFMDNNNKKETANQIILKNNAILSTQVINEICVNLIKKAEYSEDDIYLLVNNIYFNYIVSTIERDDILKSSFLRKSYNISFWDSLIVAVALKNNCTILFTEDMQHNQIIEDQLKILNPFD